MRGYLLVNISGRRKKLDMINSKNILKEFTSGFGMQYRSYKNSVMNDNKRWFLLAKDRSKKYLFVIVSGRQSESLKEFEGKTIGTIKIDCSDLIVLRANTGFKNLKLLQNIFPHLQPVFCGLKPSFGTGDRLGIATPAHISSFKSREIFPYLCQQSVRELIKTGHSWQDVISNTAWGLFETGCKKPFGADADHVKEIGDLNSAIRNGFTMFTIDPSDFILSGSQDRDKICKKYNSIPEKKEIEKFYLGKKITINKKVLEFNLDSLKFVAASYFEAIKHVVRCYKFIIQNKKNNFDFEVSMDEVDDEISPLAHLFITTELQRNEVNFHNIALRYPGMWEKAVDYVGDIANFSLEIKMHAGIAKKLGPYKLSLHSGSEKFSIYKIFSEETEGLFHIKTSGTSWLESLRTIAVKSPDLFMDIYHYAVKSYEEEKISYHISTEVSSIPDIGKFKKDKLESLLDLKQCRQMLHVTFGAILTAKKDGNYIFSDSIYKILFENEPLYYNYVAKNIDRHLELVSIYKNN